MAFFFSRAGSNQIDGTDQRDFIWISSFKRGDDTVNAGGGNDYVRVSGVGNHQIFAEDGDDIVNAWSSRGDLLIDGGAGNDRLYSGRGDDTVSGGDGNDIIFAPDGDNVLSGGAGNDVISVLRGNNVINGGDGNDRIRAVNGNNTIESGDGDNIIRTIRGDNTIILGSGNNSVVTTQGTNTVVLTGSILDAALDLGGTSVGIGLNGATNTLSGVTQVNFVDGGETHSLLLDGSNNDVVAVDDAATISEGDSLVLGAAELLGNDFDPDGDALSLVSVSGPDVTDNLDGTYTFAPAVLESAAQGTSREVELTYTVSDGNGSTDVGTVTVTIDGVNDGPVALADTAVLTAISGVTTTDLDALIVNDSLPANWGSFPVQILTYDGAGGFTASDIPAENYRGNRAELGDFDGDGDLDAIALVVGANNRVLVNQGGAQGGVEGQFIGTDIAGTAGFALGIDIGDVDGDGDLDAVQVDWFNGAKHVYVNQGGAQGGVQGSFVTQNLPIAPSIGGREFHRLDAGGRQFDLQRSRLWRSRRRWRGPRGRCQWSAGFDGGRFL